MKKEERSACCFGSRFPTFAVVLLVLAVIWLLSELAVITVDIPWIPVVLIVVAVGMIINRYRN